MVLNKFSWSLCSESRVKKHVRSFFLISFSCAACRCYEYALLLCTCTVAVSEASVFVSVRWLPVIIMYFSNTLYLHTREQRRILKPNQLIDSITLFHIIKHMIRRHTISLNLNMLTIVVWDGKKMCVHWVSHSRHRHFGCQEGEQYWWQIFGTRASPKKTVLRDQPRIR